MGLGEVKAAITEKTKLEVAAIMDAAKNEAAGIINEAQLAVSKKREEHSSQTKTIMDAMERKELAAGQQQRKSMLLEEKRKAIEAVFTSVASSLGSMPDNERNEILAKLAAKAAAAIDVQRILCNSRDIQALGKLFPNATVVADKRITGGFIADNSNGSVRSDYTYDTLLAAVREQRLAELSNLLFP